MGPLGGEQLVGPREPPPSLRGDPKVDDAAVVVGGSPLEEDGAAMAPTRVVDFKPEIPLYNIHDYQSTHPTGGCIMGTDPGNSVTNSYGQVWDTPNVFVTGAALFPQNPGANPTGTVGALAYRTAEAMLDRTFDDPDALLD